MARISVYVILQKSATSREAVAGSGSLSIPMETSPPLVAAVISGRPSLASWGFMLVGYTDRRKKFSN